MDPAQEGVKRRVHTEEVDDNPADCHDSRPTSVQSIREQCRDTRRDVDDGEGGSKIVQPTPVSQQLLRVAQFRQSTLILNLLVDNASRHLVGLLSERLESCRHAVVSRSFRTVNFSIPAFMCLQGFSPSFFACCRDVSPG